MTIAYVGFLNSLNQKLYSACIRTPHCKSWMPEHAEQEWSGDSNTSILISNSDDVGADRCLELELITFQSIDIIENLLREQLSRDSGGVSSAHDCFLGCLGPCMLTPCNLDAKTYAYVSSTMTKILVVAERSDINNAEMKNFCKALYRLYAETVANPFFTGQIESPVFNRKLEEIVRHYRGTLELVD